jgi:heptosyltransferase-2
MKTLIIKTAALGDVLRTTILLNEIDGDIYWITHKNASDLLNSHKIKRKIFIEDSKDVESLLNINFDLVLSLEEDIELLKIVSKIKSKKLIGLFIKDNNVDYTEQGKEWFDMSLSSKYGKEKADLLKKSNRKSHNQMFIEMLGKDFVGQEYDLGYIGKKSFNRTIGIIDRCGKVWPSKNWSGYSELKDMLANEGFNVVNLSERNSIKEHIDDINNCELIVCGDTLGMHIALALKKKVVSLFNCTSPYEIYDYKRMIKIVSPLYERFFYTKELNEELIKSIKVRDVFDAVKELIR